VNFFLKEMNKRREVEKLVNLFQSEYSIEVEEIFSFFLKKNGT